MRALRYQGCFVETDGGYNCLSTPNTSHRIRLEYTSWWSRRPRDPWCEDDSLQSTSRELQIPRYTSREMADMFNAHVAVRYAQLPSVRQIRRRKMHSCLHVKDSTTHI